MWTTAAAQILCMRVLAVQYSWPLASCIAATYLASNWDTIARLNLRVLICRAWRASGNGSRGPGYHGHLALLLCCLSGLLQRPAMGSWWRAHQQIAGGIPQQMPLKGCTYMQQLFGSFFIWMKALYDSPKSLQDMNFFVESLRAAFLLSIACTIVIQFLSRNVGEEQLHGLLQPLSRLLW